MASNVYSKLNEARIKMQGIGLKQNGVNDFAKYKYFELADILPASNKICSEINATIYTQFDDKAHLFFVDNDTSERIEFTLPMSTASLKGCHEVQNLGAVQTYLKRYLYQNCYELSEIDVLDKTMNPNEKKQEPKQVNTDVTPKTKAEAELIVKKFVELAKGTYIRQDSLVAMYKAYDDLKTEADYLKFISNCKANITQAEKAKAEGLNDDEIPF